MTSAVDGLVEAVASRFPDKYKVQARGLRTEELQRSVLEATIRGQQDHLSLPEVPKHGQLQWVGVPSSVKRYPLDEKVLGAIFTAMLVEDHLPGFSRSYAEIFRTERQLGQTEPIDRSDWVINRLAQDFVQIWTYQENGHALSFRLWLILSGLVDTENLFDEMFDVGEKYYEPPSREPAGLFAYTVVQEASTRLFYDMILRKVEEPILQSILRKLRRQEAEHSQAFRAFLAPAIARGERKTYEAISETFSHFAMPMAGMMKNYVRRAITMRRATDGYDYRQGFTTFRALVDKVARAKTGLVDHPVHQLLDYATSLCPSTL